MLSTQLQDTAKARAHTPRAGHACFRARACTSRRARHAAGTHRGAWECHRHAVSTQILSTQPGARIVGTRVLGTQD
eukprot:3245005-Alexandrium_andersonii.AAC.1